MKNYNITETQNWKIGHITQENGKWFAEVTNGIERKHSGDLWGWEGMTYNYLKIRNDYNVI